MSIPCLVCARRFKRTVEIVSPVVWLHFMLSACYSLTPLILAIHVGLKWLLM